MSTETQTNEVVKYINEKPECPAESENVKYEVREIGRTVKTTSGEETLKKFVVVPIAKTIPGMQEITGGDVAKALDAFNSGIYAVIRVQTSNELQGGSPEDKAFARVVKSVAKLPMFNGKSEEEIATTLRGNPALMELFKAA